MRSAPWPVGLIFGLGVALLIVLAGPLLLFNPWFVGALPNGDPLLDPRERSHMRDVAGLFRLLVLVAGVAGSVVALTHAALRAESRRVGAVLLAVGGGLAAAGLLLALVFAVAFER